MTFSETKYRMNMCVAKGKRRVWQKGKRIKKTRERDNGVCAAKRSSGGGVFDPWGIYMS